MNQTLWLCDKRATGVTPQPEPYNLTRTLNQRNDKHPQTELHSFITDLNFDILNTTNLLQTKIHPKRQLENKKT